MQAPVRNLSQQNSTSKGVVAKQLSCASCVSRLWQPPLLAQRTVSQTFNRLSLAVVTCKQTGSGGIIPPAVARSSTGMAGRQLLSVAPMMDWTDVHFRQLARLISKRTWLWTEMVVDKTILHTNQLDKQLWFPPEQHPLVCQMGGSDPATLEKAAAVVAQYGYDEINLNCGCPSDRVAGAGCFGAAMMLQPSVVGECMAAIAAGANAVATDDARNSGTIDNNCTDNAAHAADSSRDGSSSTTTTTNNNNNNNTSSSNTAAPSAAQQLAATATASESAVPTTICALASSPAACQRVIPVTVKCRLGVDDYDSYASLVEFVCTVSTNSPTRHFILHARKCFLSGLSPAQNRSVPPLRPDWAWALARDFPHLQISLNGGVQSCHEAAAAIAVTSTGTGSNMDSNGHSFNDGSIMYSSSNNHNVATPHVDNPSHSGSGGDALCFHDSSQQSANRVRQSISGRDTGSSSSSSSSSSSDEQQLDHQHSSRSAIETVASLSHSGRPGSQAHSERTGQSHTHQSTAAPSADSTLQVPQSDAVLEDNQVGSEQQQQQQQRLHHPIEGVMIGRAAYNDPWGCLSDADRAVFGEATNAAVNRRQVMKDYALYADSVVGKWAVKPDGHRDPSVRTLMRPILNLFHGERNGKAWKAAVDTFLRESMTPEGTPWPHKEPPSVAAVLDATLHILPDEILDAPPVQVHTLPAFPLSATLPSLSSRAGHEDEHDRAIAEKAMRRAQRSKLGQKKAKRAAAAAAQAAAATAVNALHSDDSTHESAALQARDGGLKASGLSWSDGEGSGSGSEGEREVSQQMSKVHVDVPKLQEVHAAA